LAAGHDLAAGEADGGADLAPPVDARARGGIVGSVSLDGGGSSSCSPGAPSRRQSTVGAPRAPSDVAGLREARGVPNPRRTGGNQRYRRSTLAAREPLDLQSFTRHAAAPRDSLKIVVSPVRVRVSPSARGDGIHAHDRGRRPDRFESGSRHQLALTASMPMTGDAVPTGSSPSAAIVERPTVRGSWAHGGPYFGGRGSRPAQRRPAWHHRSGGRTSRSNVAYVAARASISSRC
jgi:hypothetical protein